MSLRDDDDLMRVGRAHGKAGSAGPSLFLLTRDYSYRVEDD